MPLYFVWPLPGKRRGTFSWFPCFLRVLDTLHPPLPTADLPIHAIPHSETDPCDNRAASCNKSGGVCVGGWKLTLSSWYANMSWMSLFWDLCCSQGKQNKTTTGRDKLLHAWISLYLQRDRSPSPSVLSYSPSFSLSYLSSCSPSCCYKKVNPLRTRLAGKKKTIRVKSQVVLLGSVWQVDTSRLWACERDSPPL